MYIISIIYYKLSSIQIYKNYCLSVYPLYILMKNWTDFDEIVWMCLSGSPDDLDSQLDQAGPTRGGAKAVMLQGFTMVLVYKSLLLVMGEIICRNKYLLYFN